MLNYVITFFTLAIIAAFFGFGGLANDFAEIARFLALIFVVLFVFSLIGHTRSSRYRFITINNVDLSIIINGEFIKKILVLSSAIILLTSYTAEAQISVSLGVPVYAAPGYVVAPDWPSQHYDIHRHRHNDYWAKRQQGERDHGNHDNGHR